MRQKVKVFLIVLTGSYLPFYCFSQVLINEVCPANADIIYEKTFYNFAGWVELHNSSSREVDLSGYYLSDDFTQATKWQVPAGTTVAPNGYLLVFCDKMDTLLHTSFSLDEKGGELVLYNTALQVMDKITYPLQYTNISYGRVNVALGYMAHPSPGLPNNSLTAGERLQKPGVSLQSGRYGAALGIRFSHPRSGVAVRYTTDGSEPTERSALYDKPVTIDKTMVLKAKAFKNGFLPSETAVFTYFINEHLFTLPVVSLSAKPEYLWDDQIGIYVEGTNGINGNCRNKAVNYNQEWDRHASFQLFAYTGEIKFEQEVDFRIHGGCSRTSYQKSFAVKARDKYGDNHLKNAFFPAKRVSRYGGLLLRNSGNDNQSTMFRDALMHTLISGQMDLDHQAYQPAILYLNGEYWGIQNLREKIDADYIESNFGIAGGDIDLLEQNGIVVEGSADAYFAYMDGLRNMSLEDSSAFNYIDKHIDVQEYINYMVAEIYYANTDWPGNNVKFWRQRSGNGKFRWLLWDTDFGFGHIKNTPSMASHPTLEFATDPDNSEWPNPAWSTEHFRLLLQNPVFRIRFIETMNSAIATTFHPERVIKVIDSLQTNLEGEISKHLERWSGDVTNWRGEIQLMRDFAFYRNAFMKKHMAEFFSLNGNVKVSLDIKEAQGGYRFNNLYASNSFQDKTYTKNIPYSLEALPKEGFSFKKYRVTRRDVDERLLIDKGDTWKFFDLGRFPGTDWKNSGFNDQAWKAGPARIGYGDEKEATLAAFGPQRKDKYVTTYFRKKFFLDKLEGLSHLEASLLYDDGAVVYLNGKEVYRGNMPLGEVHYSTYAAAIVYGEDIFLDFRIPAEFVVKGENILTVEVHQISGESSDLSFDMSLKGVYLKEAEVSSHQSPVLSGRMNTHTSFEIMFAPIVDNSGVVINEFSATKNSLIKDEYGEREDWIELYNGGHNAVDVDGFYITDDLGNRTKYQLQGADGALLINPGTYLILWADDQAHQGPKHLNFKLSSNGEELGLYEMVGGELVVHDEATYDYLPDNYSLARIPDGSGPFVPTGRMTPLSENLQEDGEELEVLIYPNPAESYLNIQSKQKIDRVEVYDLFGRRLAEFNEVNGEPIFIYNYDQGLYIFKIISGDQVFEAKIIKF